MKFSVTFHGKNVAKYGKKTHLLIVKRNGNVQILCKPSNIVIVNDGIDIIRKGRKDHHIRILVDIMSDQLIKTLQVT